jgi:hypothetical protein
MTAAHRRHIASSPRTCLLDPAQNVFRLRNRHFEPVTFMRNWRKSGPNLVECDDQLPK